MEQFSFYAKSLDRLPIQKMGELAGDGEFSREEIAENAIYRYRWPDLSITFTEMPEREIPSHLQGFQAFVQANWQQAEFHPTLLEEIGKTRLVVNIVLEPGRDQQGRCNEILGAMARGLGALVFHNNQVFDWQLQPLTGKAFSTQNSGNNSLNNNSIETPSGNELTMAQRQRWENAKMELSSRKVPTPYFPLVVQDDRDVELRNPQEVANRILILSAVTLRAEGASLERVQQILDRYDLHGLLSPGEVDFLHAESLDQEKARQLLWKLESLWLLGWAVGEMETLAWPDTMCDVPQLVTWLDKIEANGEVLQTLNLRPKSEILDAQQLTLLLHWALRDAWINRRRIPEDLNWAGIAPMVSVSMSAAVGIIAERNHAFNWLCQLENVEWDDAIYPA